MLDNHLIRDLSERLSALVPAANEFRQETRAKIEQALKSGLKDMDILTREEFEGQAQALSRAQQRVAELESQLSSLESRLTELEQQSK